MRIALLQLNFTVGDIEGNALKIIDAVRTATEQAAPGIKVTDRSFGTGWRMPIAAKRNF